MARTTATIRLGFDLALVVVTAMAAWQAQSFSAEARWFPLYVGMAGMVLALANLVRDVLRYRSGHDIVASEDLEAGLRHLASGAGEDTAGEDADPQPTGGRTSARTWLGLLLGYFVLVAVLGYVIATAIWLPVFLRFESRRSVPFALVTTAVVVVVLVALRMYVGVGFPPSLVVELRQFPFGRYLT